MRSSVIRNDKGAILLHVIMIGAFIGVLLYTMMEYNARLRNQTMNQIKRFTKSDMSLLIEQLAISPGGLVKSEELDNGPVIPPP